MFRLYRLLFLLPFVSIAFNVTAQASFPMLNNKYQLTTEAQLTENYSPKINTFWENNAQENKFESKLGGTIHTVSIKTGQANAIVISQGRNESVLKYKELAFDLNKQGYDIFLIDHRGQGFSSRLGGDLYRGHVQSFNDYVIDLTSFIDSLQLPENYQSRFLLAHSMGGTINALYLESRSHPFQAAAFFSPMFSINLSGLPVFVAKIITYISDLICSWFSDTACYAPGVGAYSETNFNNNKLTHSTKRFSSAFNTFEHAPETQLGGATMRWVNESLFAMNKAIQQSSKINIPIILIQSGEDLIVTAQGQHQFFEKNQLCKQSQFIHIANARHELLLEKDEYRIPALTATLDFFQQQQQGNLSCTK